MLGKNDILIRGGAVADGTGAPVREADVALKDGRVVAIGKDLGSASEEIDARGKLVTPGFVDIHTHYDGQAVWDSRMQPSSWHGVTTAVMGNCGVGFAPVREGDRQRLIELMEGVEDIPGAALHEGLSWSWESFGDYLDALEARPRDIDICAQLPHGALRVFVMGERGARLEAANPDDIAAMRRLAREAAEAGAIGFSTSRTLNHRTITGDPTPSLRATEDELLAIAMGLKDAGRGVLEFISDWNTPDAETEFAMVRRLVAQSGRPLSFSLGQRHSEPHAWRKLLELTDAAVREGLSIRAQVAPRPIGVLLGLQGSRNPFFSLRAYREIADRPLEARVAIMRQPEFRKRLLEEAKALPTGDAAHRRLAAFDRMFALGDPPDYEPPLSDSIAARAAREGRTAADLAYDILLEQDGRSFILAPFANYADGNLDVCRQMLDHPHTLVGLGDGGAHVSIISDASFSTYLLAHWGRDRASGRFPIERLVRKHTQDNARAVGLLDRGVLAPGMKGDVNVIDLDRLRVERPYMSADLPAGGKRLLQPARGYVATIVSGQVTYRDGEPTAALPGRLVRGPQSAPAAA
ncbi:N-acyl-D-amino-acid deacylase family protein [Vineibacter terrae]|uniref:N-acyl-D-amino-acid deacylase family protein n=1 Tax=Vineibacter terrae TaxID=2586908 RepID=UPI002E32D4C1|nr:amidohydrolase family protein [Vineibacter terrae]HEX2892236.1 amidohydrolase family protein [Vineibacter terrae]